MPYDLDFEYDPATLDSKFPKCVPHDLRPETPSFLARVRGFGFHNLQFRFGQARRARSFKITQASDALLQAFGFRAMNAV